MFQKHHFRELTKEAQESLGEIPDEFTRYWTNRFPLLLVHAYITMQCVSDELTFQVYYDGSFKYSLDAFRNQVCKYVESNPVIMPPDTNLDHFDKRRTLTSTETYEKYKSSSARSSPRRLPKSLPETGGLYRNLNQKSVDLNDITINLKENCDKDSVYVPPQKRESVPLKLRARKKKKVDEPLKWNIKD